MSVGLLKFFFLIGMYITSSYAGECRDKCETMIRDVLTMEMCR
jgi:hypothetical protein